MEISFSKSMFKEIFNGNYYPIGTAFTKIYNELSSLTYNNKFCLNSYKNNALCDYQQFALAKMSIDRISSILDIKPLPDINNNTTLTIQNVDIEPLEFEKLVEFITKLDEFIDLSLHDKRLNTPQRYLYFFTVIYKYSIPTYEIIDDELLAKYQSSLDDMSKNNNFQSNNEHYNSILEHDKAILREIGKSENIIYKYQCNNFIELLLVSYLYIIENNLNFKQCAYCGRFFIASNGNQKFCDNIRPQEINESDIKYNSQKISCREFNKQNPFKSNSKEVERVIRKIKLRIQKRIRNNIETPEYLEKWEKLIAFQRAKLIDNNKYIKWLENESDTHQKRRRKNGSSRNNKK